MNTIFIDQKVLLIAIALKEQLMASSAPKKAKWQYFIGPSIIIDIEY